MTSVNKTHMFTAAAFGAAGLFTMLSFNGTAEASTSLSNCMGSTAGKVISCCEQLTEAGRPMWMIESKSSCRKATVCRKTLHSTAVAVTRCYVQVLRIEKEGGDNQPEGRRGSGQK